MNVTWFLIPLAAAVSVVWNASRFEATDVIVGRSLRMFVQILFFMALILGLLVLLSRGL